MKEQVCFGCLTKYFENDVCPKCMCDNNYYNMFEYEPVDENSYKIKKFLKKEEIKNLVLPSKFQNKPITAVGYSAFNRSKMVEITINSGCIDIYDVAFEDCKELEKVNLPNSIKSIGSGAFLSCEKLKTINLCDGLKIIDSCAFARKE